MDTNTKYVYGLYLPEVVIDLINDYTLNVCDDCNGDTNIYKTCNFIKVNGSKIKTCNNILCKDCLDYHCYTCDGYYCSDCIIDPTEGIHDFYNCYNCGDGVCCDCWRYCRNCHHHLCKDCKKSHGCLYICDYCDESIQNEDDVVGDDDIEIYHKTCYDEIQKGRPETDSDE